VVILLLAVAPAWSWGTAGHRIVAIIAEQRLSPSVREKIRMLLMDGKYSLADISNCADQIRESDRTRPEDKMCRSMAGDVPATNATWHYIQIPVPTQGTALEAFCPQGDCVTAKIASFTETLRTSKDEGQRRQALLFLVHLFGDIHQPLHTVNRACDNGGNSERVRFSPEGQYSKENLHQVWDTAELDLLMAGYSVADERTFAGALIASISSVDAEKWSRATPEEMTWESYKIAITEVYPAVPYQNFCGGRESALIKTDLSTPYEEDGAKIVQLQLIKAGVRLAAILESVFGEP
jgi:hypothetical protein